MLRTIEPAERLHGILKVPGDASISHRALILGALARGKQVINGLSPAEGVHQTMQVLRDLGCFVETMPDGRTLVLSHGLDEEATLDAGNSETTARLLAGLVAGTGSKVTILGSESLRRRPMTDVAEPLIEMGAVVTLAEGGTLPMTIAGGGLSGIRYENRTAGAHVKSAVLIAGLLASGETTVVDSIPTCDHTERMFRTMGADIRTNENEVTVTGGTKMHGAHISIPGDCSSIAYFAAAATCLPKSEVYLPVTGVNPTRVGFLEVLKGMGADVAFDNAHEMSGEPAADVIVRTPVGGLRGAVVDDPARIATVIAEIPLLAVVATQAEGETVVRGVSELGERDIERTAAVVRNLTAMGADVERLADGFVVRGPTRLKGAKVSVSGDHRVAMAMTVAGLIAEDETTLDDVSVVETAYPNFYNDLRTLLP